MAIILDTSALIEIERAIQNHYNLELPQDDTVIVPAIVWAEALIGVRMARTPLGAAQRRARLETIRSKAEVVSFSPEIAEHYADIFYELSKRGLMIPQNDIAVAATGRALKQIIVVGPHDEAHFRRVKGIDVYRIGQK